MSCRARFALGILALAGCKSDPADHGMKTSVVDAAAAAPVATVTMIVGHDAGMVTVGGAGNGLGISDEQLRATLNPSNLPDYAGPTGTIEGTVLIDGDPALPRAEKPPSPRCPDSAVLFAKQFREGTANEKDERPLADAAIGVIDPTPDSTFYVPPRGRAETLTIQGCAPDKRTIAMTFGQSLDVANRGPKVTAPQLEPNPPGALMLAPPGGDPVHLYPPKPGHYRLIDMLKTTALDQDLYVFQFALHDVSDTLGHFHVAGVPSGKRRVFAHLPATDEEAFVDVDVPVTGSVNATIVIHHKNKAPAIVDAAAPTPPPVVH